MARNDKDDRTSVSRSFFIGNGSHCAVHLINSGLSVYGDNAKVEFVTSGLPVSAIRCTVDSQQFPCKHGWQIKLVGDNYFRFNIHCIAGKFCKVHFVGLIFTFRSLTVKIPGPMKNSLYAVLVCFF